MKRHPPKEFLTNRLQKEDSSISLAKPANERQDNSESNILPIVVQDMNLAFHTVLDQLDSYVYIKDMQGRYTYVNRKSLELLGIPIEEIIGRDDSEFFDLTLSNELRLNDRRVLELGETMEMEERNILKSTGEQRIYKSIKMPVRNPQGQIIGMCGISTDITENKKQEAVAKHHTLMISNTRDGFWVTDSEGNILEANQAYATMSGYSINELMQMHISQLDALDDYDKVKGRIETILSQGYLLFESQHRRKDGRLFHVEVSVNYLPELQQFYAFFRDVTDRRMHERKIHFLTQTYAALSKTNQAIIESLDENTLFSRTCQIVVESGGMEFAWIGANERISDRIMPTAAFGAHTEYLEKIVISSRDDVPEGCGPTGTAFREGRPVFIQDIKADSMLAYWRDRITKYGWNASGSVPIMRNGRPYAVLSFYHTKEYIFTDETISLLKEMARNIGYGLDRTDLRQAEQQYRASMELATMIYKSSAEAIMVTDENNLIIDANPAFTAISGYTLEEVQGRDPSMLQSGRHDKEFYQRMWQDILTTGHWQGEIWDRRKDGLVHPKQAHISVIRHPDGSIYRHVVQFFDITDKKQKEATIWKQANFDLLTGLPNRRLLEDRLEQEIKKVKRSGLPLALLFIDLDRLKEVNDTIGHASGDQLLVETANRISRCIRVTDTVARFGGDEFIVVLSEFGERDDVERIAHSIIHTLAMPFDLGGGNLSYVSASIGIAIYPDDARDSASLMKNSDQAMYFAKAEGGNRFSYFTQSMQIEAKEKLALTNDLRQALSRNELQVYYQPILEMESGRIAKAEALLRWKHPSRGMISPAVFIPLAEEAKLINEIGEWVFQQVISCVGHWHKLFGRIIQVSVNKSPVQFEKAEEQAWIGQMNELGLPGSAITVEITEGFLLKQSPKAKQHLLECRNSGIAVSIDDFGTGFSSLSYLKQFDIDYVKIDRSFIKELEMNADDRALTEAIIVMAHKLGIKTIAEGVETQGQRELLRSYGCDYFQGFLFSPAVPAEEFEQFIARMT
jgi:diguanylate cyclase (GGDEF)-like protein/PAS domain S-box-containing protein